jgi:hypothetical protein
MFIAGFTETGFTGFWFYFYFMKPISTIKNPCLSLVLQKLVSLVSGFNFTL